MITPRVRSIRDGRADFEELEVVSDGHLHLSDDRRAGVRVWRAPDGAEVVHVSTHGLITAADVESIVEPFDLGDGGHLFLSAEAYEEGLEAALDAAVGQYVKVSLMEWEQDPPEVREVPMPDPAPAVPVTMTISEADFEFLMGTSQGFDFERASEYLEPYDEGKVPGYDEVGSHWKMMYVLDREGGYANVMLARAFLAGNGYPYELAGAPNEDGTSAWVLLTDFKTAGWRHYDEQQKVRERLAKEKAEKSGDPLMQAYLAPSATKEGESDGEAASE